MIGRIISHYRILGQLGEGGMGVVYVAEDTNLGRRVAIKLPLSHGDGDHGGIFRSRFLREARAISALSHQHIASVYDYGETDEGQPFIVMELVTGQSLNELVHTSALTIARAVEIVMDVAEALAEAHCHGVVHRDVKPSNVMLNERGEVKVLDFGLAKQLEGANGESASGPDAQTLISTQTRSDVVIGTPLYLSPEQARGAPVDGRSDLFALGALLYECIAGRPAFSGANVIEIGGQVLHVDPPPPSHFNSRVTAELDRITLKALAKRPEARYQSAAEMHDELGAALATLPESDTTRTRRILSRQITGARSSALMTLSEGLRRPRLSPAAFLFALALALVAVWGVVRWRRPAPHVPTPQAAALFERGTNLLRDGAYEQASRALQSAVEADGEYALAHAALAEAWMELDYGARVNDELLMAKTLVSDSSVLPQLQSLYLDAVTSTALRKFPEAVKAYAEITRLKPNEPQAYVDLGRAYERNEEPQKAVESYLDAVKRDERYATAHLRLAVLQGRQSQIPNALEGFRRAGELYAQQGNEEGRAETLFQRGFFYNATGKFPEAHDDMERALELARAGGNQYQRVQALLALSSVSLNGTRQFKEAEQFARDAIEIARAEGMYNLNARGLIDLGNVFMTRGDYAGAERQFQESLKLAQNYKLARSQARAEFALASVYTQQYRTDEAIEFAKKALGYYQSGGFRKEALQALTFLGRAQRRKGDYAAALETFERQLREAQEIGYRTYMAISNTDFGRVLFQQERYREALEHYEEGSAINKADKNQRGLGYSLMHRATALESLGHYAEARPMLDEASEIARGSFNALLADLYAVEAQLALGQRRFAEALSLADQSLAINGAQAPDTTAEAARVRCLAQAYSGAGRGALASCEEALANATRTADFWLTTRAQLALAEALIEAGDAPGALSLALAVRESFARTGQPASEWRALLVAARAARRTRHETGAREYAARARDLLAGLEQRWGGESYQSYLSRPDVQFSRRQLEELLAAAAE